MVHIVSFSLVRVASPADAMSETSLSEKKLVVKSFQVNNLKGFFYYSKFVSINKKKRKVG